MTPFTYRIGSIGKWAFHTAKYMTTWQICFWHWGFLQFCLFFYSPLFLQRGGRQQIYKTNLLLIIIFVLIFSGAKNAGIEKRWLSTYFGNLGYAYEDYGVPYCFLNTWLIRGIPMPEGYSSYMVRKIFDDGIPMGNRNADPSIPVLQTVIAAKRRLTWYCPAGIFYRPTSSKIVTFPKTRSQLHRLQKQGSAGF